MTRKRRRIAELAELRRKTVELAGETVVLIEPTALINAEYRKLLKAGERKAAIAYIIRECCEDIDGQPFFDEAESLIVAGGRSEVFAPIVGGITEFLSLEKKLPPLTPTDDSSSGSLSPSDAPPVSSSAS